MHAGAVTVIAKTPDQKPFSVALPSNLSSVTPAPGFVFRPVKNARTPRVSMYVCRDVLLAWNWYDGAVVFDCEGFAALALQKEDNRQSFTHRASIEAVQKVTGRAVSLVQFTSRKNYAHFLLESFSKLFYFKAVCGEEAFDYYLVDKFMARAFEELSELLQLRGKPIYLEKNGAMHFECLYTTSHVYHPMNRNDPILLEGYRALLHHVSIKTPGPKRIFIDRKSGSRGLVNKAAVMSLLAKYAIETVSFDDLSVVQQIRLIRNANVITGIHGAAFANLVFADVSQNVAAVEIMPKSFGMQSYWLLARNLGIEYCAVGPVGGWEAEKNPKTKFDDIDVDLVAFEHAILLSIAHVQA